jgi:hypothetical protein
MAGRLCAAEKSFLEDLAESAHSMPWYGGGLEGLPMLHAHIESFDLVLSRDAWVIAVVVGAVVIAAFTRR